jgi:hypothetical protein
VVFSDQLDLGSASEAQFQFAATHYAGAQKLLLSYVQHLRTYNPGFVLLHYRLGSALGYTAADASCNPTTQYLQIIDGDHWVQEWPGDSVVQNSWFYQYGGSRVYSCSGGHYLTQLPDNGWRSFWSAQVIQQMQDCQADGIFADSYSVPNYLGANDFKPALPAIDMTFETTWSGWLHDFTDYMRGQFAGGYYWIPNIGSWITNRDATDYSNIDGAMIEGFAETGGGGYLALSDWQLQMNRVLGLINADKVILAQTYPSATDVGERMFILGTYLLVKGAHTYVNMMSFGTVVQWFPEYAIDLGAPTDALPSDISTYLDATSNVYVRHYTKGLVLVNPSGSAHTATLSTTYYQVVPSGGGVVPADGFTPGSLSTSAVTSVNLAAHTAAVLLNASL